MFFFRIIGTVHAERGLDMFRYAIALVLCHIAFADIADFSASASWSFTSTGSNGPNASSAFGMGGGTLNFDVLLPPGAVISEAVLNVSQSTNIPLCGLPNVLLCQKPPNPVTGFPLFPITGCSDIPLSSPPPQCNVPGCTLSGHHHSECVRTGPA